MKIENKNSWRSELLVTDSTWAELGFCLFLIGYSGTLITLSCPVVLGECWLYFSKLSVPANRLKMDPCVDPNRESSL